MRNIELDSVENRMRSMLDTAWSTCLQRIVTGRVSINKEASLQLHYAYVLAQMGELACIQRKESFTIELETHHAGKDIDIWCALGDCEAAIELKCFRKSSNRALECDMYDVLKDISRLESYTHVTLRRFVCFTDNGYYANAAHKGHARWVSIADGKKYPKNIPIAPSWKGKWKDNTRDADITLKNDLEFAWSKAGDWYYLYMEV